MIIYYSQKAVDKTSMKNMKYACNSRKSLNVDRCDYCMSAYPLLPVSERYRKVEFQFFSQVLTTVNSLRFSTTLFAVVMFNFISSSAPLP